MLYSLNNMMVSNYSKTWRIFKKMLQIII